MNRDRSFHAPTKSGRLGQREGKLLTEEVARDRYQKLLSASEAERAGRAGAKITTMQAWCPEPTKGCALPVEEAYDFYERARESFAPMFQNKISSTSFQNLQADENAFAIRLSRAPILILHP